MPYLIDGHNLIGVIPEIGLHDPDDEAKLVRLLQAFCSRQRTAATVYFDRAAVGRSDPPPTAGVRVHFVRPPATADTAIGKHLARLGREAPNWVVVSSDAAVARSARRARARTLPSHEFAQRLAGTAPDQPTVEKPEGGVPPDEIEAWEAAFRSGRGNPRKSGR